MTSHYTKADKLKHEALTLRNNMSEVIKSIDRIIELLED